MSTYNGFTESDEVIAQRKVRILSSHAVSLSPAKPLSGQKLVEFVNAVLTTIEVAEQTIELNGEMLEMRISLLELEDDMERGV